MKAYIETFGCQMNEYDSERILYYLEKMGYESTQAIEDSDIIIINTCAVREKAENRLFGHLGSLKRLKETSDVIICVGGCTAQGLAKRIQDRFPFVDIVFGTHNISLLPGLIQKKLENKKNICSVINEGFDYDLGEAKRTDSFRALIPISIGCNNFCSYCIVPYVRGSEKSIEPGKLIETVKRFVDEGVLEVTLLGQNVNSYGKDLKGAASFSHLLQEISDIEDLKRIRFMTSHPKDFSHSLVEVIRDRDNIVNHIHLPLQAGSNKILDMMNRRYTREKYMDIIEDIRGNIKDCSITTDIIVGFPGEKEKDFRDTLGMVKRIRFNRAFTFIYSPREGTSAAGLKDPVILKEKKTWFEELLETQNSISHEENLRFIKKKFKVLIEGFSPKDDGLLQGRMENNTVVLLKGNKNIIGTIVDVEVMEAKTFYVTGKIIK